MHEAAASSVSAETPDGPLAEVRRPLFGFGPEEAVDPTAPLPGTGDQLPIASLHRDEFARDLKDIVTSIDRAMHRRRETWKRIRRAYDMIPEDDAGGMEPDSARLVSEFTRSYVNIAHSRITEGILGTRPITRVDVLDDVDADDERTQQLVATARSAEQFLEDYHELDAESMVSEASLTLCMLGDCILKCRFDVTEVGGVYLDGDGKEKFETTEEGAVRLEQVANEDVLVWPLDEQKVQKLTFIGHRFYMSTAEFKGFADGLGVEAPVRDEIIEASRSSSNRPDRDERLKNQDIDPGHDPFKGEVCLIEGWGTLPIPGVDGGKPLKFQVFFWEQGCKVLWLGRNKLMRQYYPFVKAPYSPKPGSFWSDGVGHEALHVHQADGAMWNMQIDNMKVTGNNLVLTKLGTGAEESMDSEVAPGRKIATENPDGDLISVKLGQPVPEIIEAMQGNEHRGMRVTGMTSPIQGFGDPTLKSGASPSSQAQLIAQAGQKFGQVDRVVRHALLTEGMGMVFDFIVQFMPRGVFYLRQSEENAALMERVKFRPPTKPASKSFRIVARAPSAASNKEMLKQHLMVTYKMAQEHLQLVLQLGPQLVSQATFMRWSEELFLFLHELWAMATEQQEIPGVAIPDKPQPTPADERLQQVISQYEQQIQQMQMQMQQHLEQMRAGQGGMGMGAAQ